MRPFIIWTVQRTGGTNFSTNIIRLSGLPITQHEPLNHGRAYGYITDNWKNNHNKKELDDSINDFLRKGYAIKHCVENVEADVNQSLLEKSLLQDFSHIILYRNSAVDRLISLHFALQTGLWGRKKVSIAKNALGQGFDKGIPIKGLDVESLVSHEQYCNDRLMNVAINITNKNSKVYAISFEEIYEASTNESIRKISLLLSEIGFNDPTISERFVRLLRDAGDQGSKGLYKNIDGLADLKNRLRHFETLKERIQKDIPEILL